MLRISSVEGPQSYTNINNYTKSIPSYRSFFSLAKYHTYLWCIYNAFIFTCDAHTTAATSCKISFEHLVRNRQKKHLLCIDCQHEADHII